MKWLGRNLRYAIFAAFHFNALTYFSAGVFLRGGTGSYPCVPQGWHFAIRFMPNQMPLKGPHILMASTV